MLTGDVWGEGFAEAEAGLTASVMTWADLAEGECIRFFPELRSRSGAASPDFLERILARAQQMEGATEGRQDDANWLRSLMESPDVRCRTQDLRSMARFAFLTGHHPAYLWPEAEVLPTWGATAAWLGELRRHRKALMPVEVAEYLVDALERRQGRVALRDATLADLITDDLFARALIEAAERKLAGEVVEARWPSLPKRNRFFFSGVARSSLRSARALFSRLPEGRAL